MLQFSTLPVSLSKTTGRAAKRDPWAGGV